MNRKAKQVGKGEGDRKEGRDMGNGGRKELNVKKNTMKKKKKDEEE